ncbi:hypothetical protein A2814_01535 [Candidatus Nomurabacteria bacterium RIFCSPHIGHO2_01_FULL_38_19]|uniref:PrgI family protein n=1 Tax=Candidatus Nomurabacteria bacterium RIFCSPHIGHO2_01_FULL_38_19 TaxID=1801732 RepID=A0A1F6URG4_9BACT|nr:MAG: hypothetical protein A2814_01535 [Candidatus Nomurabacteria bacterium RIFCSPHIGHO2_01_FULL_38_19]
MQFKVPQFLEVEDKIFGPFTFKEFVYLAGGAGMCFVVYKLLGLIWGLIPILAIAGFAAMLTFYRPNSKPFINMLEAGFKYLLQSKLYIWKKRQNKINVRKIVVAAEKEKANIMSGYGVRLSGSKLRDLAWSLDVLDLSKHENTGS